MATWGNGSMYPGINTPAWWYGATSTSTTWTQPTIYTSQVVSSAPPPPPRERTAVEWLRDRVQEMCELAELAA